MASTSSDAKYRCQHCDLLLSKKTFERHKRLYYDDSTCQWIKKRCVSAEEPVCDFDEPSLELDAFSPNEPNHSNIPCDPPPPLVSLEQPVFDVNVNDDDMLSKFDRKQSIHYNK